LKLVIELADSEKVAKTIYDRRLIRYHDLRDILRSPGTNSDKASLLGDKIQRMVYVDRKTYYNLKDFLVRTPNFRFLSSKLEKLSKCNIVVNYVSNYSG